MYSTQFQAHRANFAKMKGMIDFCESVTLEIKRAQSKDDLRNVIEHSILHYRSTRNASREPDFIMNMIVTLQVVMTENLPPLQVQNVKEAIAIFRDYQQKNPGAVR